MSGFKFNKNQYVSMMEKNELPQIWRVQACDNSSGSNRYLVRGLTDGREKNVDEEDIYEVLMG